MFKGMFLVARSWESYARLQLMCVVQSVCFTGGSVSDTIVS